MGAASSLLYPSAQFQFIACLALCLPLARLSLYFLAPLPWNGILSLPKKTKKKKYHKGPKCNHETNNFMNLNPKCWGQLTQNSKETLIEYRSLHIYSGTRKVFCPINYVRSNFLHMLPQCVFSSRSQFGTYSGF